MAQSQVEKLMLELFCPSMPLKILHLTRDYPPACNGGMSAAVHELCHCTAHSEIEHWVISFDAWRPARQRPQTAAPPAWQEQRAGKLLRLHAADELSTARHLVSQLQVDLVIVHDPMLWRHRGDLHVAEVPSVYFVHVLHDRLNTLRGVPHTQSSRAELEALQQAESVFVPSLSVRRWLPPDVRGALRRLHHVPLPVTLRMPSDIPKQETSILYAGRFSDLKGTAELIEAIPKVVAAHPTARFIIAGGLPENPKAHQAWERRFRAALPSQYQERLELCGWLSQEALQEKYAQCAIFVHPSRVETFGLSMLDAAAAACCIVCVRGGGISDLLDHAYAVPEANPDALASTLLCALTDPVSSYAMASKAAQWARSTYTSEHTARALLTAVGQTLAATA